MPNLEKNFIKAVDRFFGIISAFQRDRRSTVVIKGILVIMGAILNFHILKYDVGESVFTPEFMALIVLWVIIAGIIFIDELQRAKEKTASDKIGDLEIKVDATNTNIEALITNINILITEIRRDRDERNKSG